MAYIMLVCHTEVELVKHLLKINGDGNSKYDNIESMLVASV